jgi:hypothetical protein
MQSPLLGERGEARKGLPQKLGQTHSSLPHREKNASRESVQSHALVPLPKKSASSVARSQTHAPKPNLSSKGVTMVWSKCARTAAKAWV